VWIWDVDARNVRQLTHGPPVTAVAWSPTADVLASVGGKVARLWDITTGARHALVPQTHDLNGAVFSRDGQRVATYGEGHHVRVFNVDTGIRLVTFDYPVSALPVTSAAFGPQGDVLLTGRGNQARLWDIATGVELRSFLGHNGQVTDVAFSATGQHLVTGSLDTVARVFNADTGALEDSFYGHTGLGINDVDFSPKHDTDRDSTAIVTAGADHTARFADKGQLPVALLGHDRAVLSASFSPDGNSVLTSSKDGTARLWDPYGEPVPEVIADYDRDVNSVAVDPTGSLIAVGGQDGAVRVLSFDGHPIRTPVSSGRPVVSVAWARGRKLLAATDDGHVRIWRDAGASVIREFDHGGKVDAAAISRDGKLAATAGLNGEARMWRVATGRFRVLRRTGADAVKAVAFDPTGRRLAAAIGQNAYTWSTANGKLLTRFAHEGETGNVEAVVFRPDGALLATSDKAYVRTWDPKTGHLRKTFVRHGSDVQDVAFSPDGRWLSSVAVRKAAVWQIGDSDLDGNFLFFVARPLLEQRGASLTSVAFTRNHTLVIGNRAGQVLEYQCRFCGGLPQLVRLAKSKLDRLGAEARR
jgi:WD40 repeat protein